MKDEQVIWDAEFNPSVKSYWLLTGCFVLLVTVFGVVLIPFWLLLGPIFASKYLKSHRCTLTDRSLKVSKGVLTRIEKTVPLDRITDVGLIQGPLMRAMGIEFLKVETAGQSSAGALVGLAGIKEGRAFRDAVLKQRERLSVATAEAAVDEDTAPQTKSRQIALLEEMSGALLRIEALLADKKNVG